ncbi:Ig-like domain-containing protein [Flavobacterium selenitireducens]|uniref:Ig-like domain-containing protein n=1 Tax=Flavobacterium selenitireducens TaxID=2722704 RepID=UPI00168B429F|nr:gliding motility-associated C-terminal domain-containing protein [Flavobacterium selenitireducens]MBD3583623.1 T9SS type B sorting domain-containing protein [Flavobacterium selenitireducens]
MRKTTFAELTYVFLIGFLVFAGCLPAFAQCPTIADNTQSFCDVQSPTIESLAVTNNGGGVVWYATATSTTPIPAGTELVNGEDYFVDNSSGSCSPRQSVVVTIYTRPTGLNFQGVCVDDPANATIANLQATGNNIRWYSSVTGGSPLPSTHVLTDNTFYYASQTNPDTGCETSRFSVLVNIGMVPVPVGPAIQQFCNLPGNTPTVANLTPNGSGYNWYATPTSVVVLPPSTPLVNGGTYYATSVDPPCESINRLEVTVQLISPNNAGTDGTFQLCQSETTTSGPVNLFNFLGGSPNATGNWTGPFPTTNGHLGTLNLSGLTVAGSPYIFTYAVGSTLCPQDDATVTITVLPMPTATVAANQNICSGQTATVTFTGTPNATITYTVNGGPNQTIVLNASGTATITQAYTITTTYTLVSVTSTGATPCSQTLSSSITITVQPTPTATIASDQSVCLGQPATVTITGTPNATVSYTINGGAVQTIVLNTSGIGTITGTYSVNTTIALVGIVTAGSPSCSQSLTGSVLITIIQPPTASISSSTNVCPGGQATVTFTGTPNATVGYTVNGGPVQTILLNALGTASITTTYTITTVYALVNVTTGGATACVQPVSGTITITVLPIPTASITANQTVCPGSSATVTFTGTPGATITYTVNGGPNQTITLDASGTATLTNTYFVTTTITLVSAVSAGTPSCSGPISGSVVIMVVPPPTVSIASNQTICSGQQATITFTGTPNAVVSYTVNGGPVQTITLSASGVASITQTFSATTTFTLISAATGGSPSCSQAQNGSVTITVIQPPTVSITSNQTICSGQSATVTFTGTPGATVTYTVNGGPNQTVVLNTSGVATITGNYTVTTTFTLVSISVAGPTTCVQPISGAIVITVLELPVATIASSQTICSGQSATVTFTGTPGAIVTYTVNGGPNQTIILDASGTATISQVYTTTTVYALVGVSTSGTPACSQPQSGTITITVVQPPTASIAANATICPGGSATVTFTGTPNATVSYTVNGGSVQTILLNAGGTASITATYDVMTVFQLVNVAVGGTAGCSQPISGSVVISVVQPPVVTISSNVAICPGDSATVTFTGDPNTVVSYTVNGGPIQTITLDASGVATITQTYLVTTVYTLVNATNSGTPACTQPVSGTITITVLTAPTATIAADATICPGESATVTFTGTPGAIVTYTVNGGPNQTITLDANGLATITQTYSTTTLYALVSAATPGTPGCSQAVSGTVTITVLTPPTASIASDQTICAGQSATVTFTGTPGAIVTYTINGGPNQTIALNALGTATITQVYTDTTVYTLISVSVTGGSGCPQNIGGTVTITVVQLPTAAIAINGSATICSGTSATIVFTGTPNAIVTYTVNNGPNQTIILDGTGSATITPTLTGTSTYTLVSASIGSCSQPLTGTVTVTVTPSPNAGNDVASANICSGGNPIDLFTLLGSQAQPGGSWSPALASGTGVFDPDVDAAGTYVYTVGASGQCPADSASVTVTIVPPVNAGDDAVLAVCSNDDVVDLFTLLGTNAQTGGVWSPALASGTGVFDPSIDPSGTYTYTISGNASCGNDSASVIVTVTPGPDAGEDGSITFCLDSAAADLFTALNGTPQTGGTWSPALASGTGVFNPAVDAPGVYTYTFVGTQPCDNDSATVTVTVNPIPDAGQDGTAILCTSYAPVDLITFLGGTPQPGGAWTPALASGTGVFDPAVDAPGLYTYTIGGGLCATDTATVNVSVFTAPNAGADSSAAVCLTVTSLDLTTLLDGTQDAGTFTDDNATGALTGTIFNPSLAGPGTYQFTYSVVGGTAPCDSDTAIVTVTVDPQPNAGTSTGTATVCASFGLFDLFTLLNGEQAGGTWTDQDGIAIINPVDLTLVAPGTYSFTYTVTNSCGTDSETVELTISPNPNLTNANIQVVTPVCAGQPVVVNFSGMSDGAYTINYSLTGSNVLANQVALLTIASGNGGISVPGSSVPNIGSTTITFNSILNNATGCDVTLTGVSATFIVNPLPTFENATMTATTVCFGNDVIVTIANATAIPDGQYVFNYTIVGLTPPDGNSGIVNVIGGQATFAVPAGSIDVAGNFTIVITGIVGQGNSCGNSSATISADFTVNAVPSLANADMSATDACFGFGSTVTITGIDAADGTYSITYAISGANTGTATLDVAIVSGETTFDIPANTLVNLGQTSITVTAIIGASSPCAGIVDPTFVATFEVTQPGTPVLEDKGNEFCGRDNPTIADLSANIEGGQSVVWYDALTGGNAYAPTDLLVHGTTYYAEFADSNCSGAVRLAITVDLTVCTDLLIPDGFSPNGDGINDDFDIVNLRDLYPNFKLEIFNRNGNVLYKGNAGTPNWDGTASQGGITVGNGVVPTGVYFFILNFNDGTRKPLQGRVYLNR